MSIQAIEFQVSEQDLKANNSPPRRRTGSFACPTTLILSIQSRQRSLTPFASKANKSAENKTTKLSKTHTSSQVEHSAVHTIFCSLPSNRIQSNPGMIDNILRYSPSIPYPRTSFSLPEASRCFDDPGDVSFEGSRFETRRGGSGNFPMKNVWHSIQFKTKQKNGYLRILSAE